MSWMQEIANLDDFSLQLEIFYREILRKVDEENYSFNDAFYKSWKEFKEGE